MLPAFAAPGVVIVDRHDAEVAAPVYPLIRPVFFGGSTGVRVRHSVSFQLVALAFVLKDRFDGPPATTT